MKRNRGIGVLRSALLAGVIVFPMLAPGAEAQSKFKTLHAFNCCNNDGRGPEASLAFDAAGNLYGTTYGGGAYGYGAVFKLTPNPDGTWAESLIHSFGNGLDGYNPVAGLIFDQSGNVYGTTLNGGIHGSGVVFKLTPSPDGNWTESVLHNFVSSGGGGANPRANLVFDHSGNLYGTTWDGGSSNEGTVFELSLNRDGSRTDKVLHQFTKKDAGFSYAGLIFDQAGNLYGTGSTSYGGDSGGAVFELMLNRDGSWSERAIYSFCSVEHCGDGGDPRAGLTFDQAGNLYGTTLAGGTYDSGVVFQLTPNPDGSWKETVLHQFTSGKDGGWPYAGLIFDTAGNLYGTTAWGGNLSHKCKGWGCGVVFKLSPSSNGGWKETVLHRFIDHPGDFPVAGVIFDTAGNLYGTTNGDFAGGTVGSVFEITP